MVICDQCGKETQAPILNGEAGLLAVGQQEPVTRALRMEVYRLAKAAGWPAVRFTTAEGWHAWQVEGGRAVWLGLLLRAWPAVLEAAAATLRAQEAMDKPTVVVELPGEQPSAAAEDPSGAISISVSEASG